MLCLHVGYNSTIQYKVDMVKKKKEEKYEWENMLSLKEKIEAWLNSIKYTEWNGGFSLKIEGGTGLNPARQQIFFKIFMYAARPINVIHTV